MSSIDFVQHKRPRGAPPHRQAFLVRPARLFDVHVHQPRRVGHAQGLVLRPAGIGVGDQHVARLKLFRGGENARDVGFDVAAHLQLKFGVALRAIHADHFRHGFRRILRNRAVQREIVAETAAQKHRDGLAAGFAENVPAGHVDRRFHVGVPAHFLIHDALHDADLGRIEPDQLRRELRDSRARTRRVSGKIRGSERAHLAVSGDAGVGRDGHDGRIENRDGVAARPFIAALMQRQLDAVDVNPGDAHALV